MAILVTGGAGYIGSVAVEDLQKQGEKVVVLDNLVYGHRQAVAGNIDFYEGNIGDKKLVENILREHEIEACMHFSAFAYVGESVEKPQIYYENNFVQTLSLLDSLIENDVKKIIFSSTCATFGEPEYTPIDEKHPQKPANPYGWSKLMTERVLADYDAAYDLKHVTLRYFNACGASERCGEHHDPETHLIPLVLQAAIGKIPHVEIFGEDYQTRDGTCVRDYIHVIDLARAHILALGVLDDRSAIYNLGCGGAGYTVREVIDTAQDVTGLEIPVRTGERRAGDPAVLIAASDKIKSELGWQPEFQDLRVIIESAWAWLRNHLRQAETKV